MAYNFAGADPGSTNYGYTTINVSPYENFKIEILEIGMLSCQINNLTNKEAKPAKSKRRKTIVVPNLPPFPFQLRRFRREWHSILEDYNIRRVTMERFQPRGGGGLMGLATESVNMMNAVVCMLADRQERAYELITAATWKNQVNKFIVLEDLYKEVSIPNHSVDSFFIAVYGMLKYFGLDWEDLDYAAIATELKDFET